MTCRDFGLLMVSDDPAERGRAARHARECRSCAEMLAAHLKVSKASSAWREAFQAPAELEDRVRRAVRGAGLGAVRRSDRSRPGDWRSRSRRERFLVPAVLAASLLASLSIGWALFSEPSGPDRTDRLLAREALAQARAAERAHARAIARLELAAAPLLAKARKPETEPERARRLLALQDRLAFLDSTIQAVHEYIEDNPGNPQVRVTLLAAYREKTEVLDQILSMETPS